MLLPFLYIQPVSKQILITEVDYIYDLKFTEGEARTRLETFLKMMDGRPSPWQ